MGANKRTLIKMWNCQKDSPSNPICVDDLVVFVCTGLYLTDNQSTLVGGVTNCCHDNFINVMK